MPSLLDHERLEVYQAALRFVESADGLIVALPRRVEAGNHLDRASTSILLNIAEGNGKSSMRDRIRFLEIAKGSALECAAALDVLTVKGLVDASRANEGKQQLVVIVRMLARLIDSCLGRIAEDPVRYGNAIDNGREQEQE